MRAPWSLLLALCLSCSAHKKEPDTPPDYLGDEEDADAGADGGIGEGGTPVATGESLARGVRLKLSPIQQPEARIRVEMEFVAAADRLRDLTLYGVAQEDLADLKASDAQGALETSTSVEGDVLRVRTARVPAPPLHVSYSVAARPFSSDPFDTALDPNRMRITGERTLLLPSRFEQTPLPVQLTLSARGLADPLRAGSCFGAGTERELELTMTGLRRCTFVAGPAGEARLEGPEGHDEAVWLGYTAFDPRLVAAETAAFRTSVRQYFKDRTQQPFTLLMVADSRKPGDFDVARRTASVLLHVGIQQTYDGPLRLAVNHQILKEWLGSKLAIGKDGDGVWFSAGVTRYLARELSFRFGLLTPDEYLAEVQRLLAVVTTSPLKGLSNQALGQRVLAGPDAELATALAVARGALHATFVAESLKPGSKAQDPFHLLLLQLYEERAKHRGPMPEKVWVDSISRKLKGFSAHFEQQITRGKPGVLPRTALGPCFSSIPTRYPEFDLGLVVAKDESGKLVQELKPGSAAARAGIRQGDRIAMIKYIKGRTDVPVELSVQRGDKIERISYKPEGRPVPGQGFRRLPNIPDTRCRR